MAFNSSIVNESRKDFSKNVDLSTGHGLAYKAIGFKYKSKLVNDLDVSTVKEVVKDVAPSLTGGVQYGISQIVIKTLNRYLTSIDIDIEGRHIDPADLAFIESISSIVAVLDMVVEVWNGMCNLTDPSVGMTHDGYLKLYQLSKPVLDYDCILIDEAQDTNPVMLDIYRNQKAKLIMVGDPYQSIYYFRGAVNAFQEIEACQTFYITTSFRFGENVANVANKILSRFGHGLPQVKGYGQDEIVSHTDMMRSQQSFMDINRSATGLVYAHFNRQEFFEENGLAKDFHFVGGVSKYNFRRFICAYNLYKGKLSKVYTPSLKMFKSWGELVGLAHKMDDSQMLSMINLVERYRASIVPTLLNFKEKNETARNADVFITTAHKAKGLEADNVLVRGDFDSSKQVAPCDGTPESISLHQETHLAYVAVTRAKRKLAIAPSAFAESLDIKN